MARERAKKATKITYRHKDGSWVEETKKEVPEKAQIETTVKPEEYNINIRSVVVAPGMTAWLPVTSKKTGYKVFLPLPIRLIHQVTDAEGGGCIVRGAHGDEASARETIVEILEMLNGYALGEGASVWSMAG